MKHHVTLIRCAPTASALAGRLASVQDESIVDWARLDLLRGREQYPLADAVYSGCMKRCWETARAIHPEQKIEVVDRLLPFRYGSFAGKTYSELMRDPDFDAWARNRELLPMPGGESFYQFAARNISIFQAIMEEAAARQTERLTIVGHGSFIRSVLRRYCVPRTRFLCTNVEWGGKVSMLYDHNEQIAYVEK